MKITDVTLTLFSWDDIPPTQYIKGAGAFGGSSQLGLLRLVTDEGLEGHAFLGSSYRGGDLDGQTLIKFLKPVVMGKDPLDRELLFQNLWKKNRATTLRAIGAMDVALWDLGGKIANLPIYKLMGGFRKKVPAYASSAILPTTQAYVDEALRIKAMGWAAYKIHPPSPWREDIEVCQAVREAVGDDYTLMLDATWSYNFEESMRVGRAIEKLGFYWYEDPLVEDDVLNYRRLCEKLDIPVMATEYSAGGLTGYAPWLTQNATDYLRGDPAIKGGISTILKGAHLAEAFYKNYEIHHGGNSLNNVANLHVTCAIKNCEFFEVLLPDATQKYGLVEDVEVREGMVTVPEGPGLGAKIDFDLIKRKTVAVLR
jgi:L-alanine-DL-glutamate epimerase-like enolase superfamily enzyme